MGADCMAEYLKERGINWVIIGQQTSVKASTQPKIEWIREIVEACDKAKIQVFLKDNLSSVFSGCTIDDKWVWDKRLGHGKLWRQELPFEGK